MCGFVVTTKIDQCRKMMNKASFRGPDGTYYWADDKIAMAHALLDISAEKTIQPYKTSRGNRLVFNGEMYDSNIPSDTEFLAEGLETYGIRFLEFTDWHGSIVYYEPKNKRLTVVRDHFGAKPLWIRREKGHIELATSLRSFLTKDIDQNYANKWHNRKWKGPGWMSVGRETMWKGINKVAPGEFYIFEGDNFENVVVGNLWNGHHIRNNKMNESKFEERCVSSVKKLAKSKQKTGHFLSGGLDSTLVLSIIKELDLDLTVYIAAYDKTPGFFHTHEGFRNESEMAVETCKQFGVPYKVLKLDPHSRWHYDRMWLNNTHYIWTDSNRRAPRYMLAKAAAKDKCKVITTGDSGDELFSGYIHHAKRYNVDYCKDYIENMKKAKWFPRMNWSNTDWFNNTLFCDLLTTSETNILQADQTAGMFGMEERPVLLGQDFVRWLLWQSGNFKFQQLPEYREGETKYLARETMSRWQPDHVRFRKKKVGWSSPWDNNHKQLLRLWSLQDVEYLKGIT